MVPNSPVDALGSHASNVRDLLVEIVRARHDRFAEAHQVAETRYATGFGSQWHDLLDDTHEAMKDRGFISHKLAPGGYKIPVVNDCLLYVWRTPGVQNAVKNFASSPTRMNGFAVEPPHPTLFDPLFGTEQPVTDTPDQLELTVRSVGDKMPLVLVMVSSTPRQLQSVAWAIATLDDEGKVQLRGQERIWEPEVIEDDVTHARESFASGTPAEPVVELRQQEQV